MSCDDSKMSGDNKACLWFAGMVTTGALIIFGALTATNQMSSERDFKLRTTAMEQGFSCNKEVLMGTTTRDWVCEAK